MLRNLQSNYNLQELHDAVNVNCEAEHQQQETVQKGWKTLKCSSWSWFMFGSHVFP